MADARYEVREYGRCFDERVYVPVSPIERSRLALCPSWLWARERVPVPEISATAGADRRTAIPNEEEGLPGSASLVN
jgi:hypothetical protein